MSSPGICYLGDKPEIRHTLDPSLLSFLVVPLVRELRSTRSCDFLNRGGGFIKGILRGVRCTKSLRVLFLHRRSPSWTTLVLYSRAVFIFNEPTKCKPSPPAARLSTCSFADFLPRTYLADFLIHIDRGRLMKFLPAIVPIPGRTQ